MATATGLNSLYAGSDQWDRAPGWMNRVIRKNRQAGFAPNPRYARSQLGLAPHDAPFPDQPSPIVTSMGPIEAPPEPLSPLMRGMGALQTIGYSPEEAASRAWSAQLKPVSGMGGGGGMFGANTEDMQRRAAAEKRFAGTPAGREAAMRTTIPEENTTLGVLGKMSGRIGGITDAEKQGWRNQEITGARTPKIANAIMARTEAARAEREAAATRNALSLKTTGDAYNQMAREGVSQGWVNRNPQSLQQRWAEPRGQMDTASAPPSVLRDQIVAAEARGPYRTAGQPGGGFTQDMAQRKAFLDMALARKATAEQGDVEGVKANYTGPWDARSPDAYGTPARSTTEMLGLLKNRLAAAGPNAQPGDVRGGGAIPWQTPVNQLGLLNAHVARPAGGDTAARLPSGLNTALPSGLNTATRAERLGLVQQAAEYRKAKRQGIGPEQWEKLKLLRRAVGSAGGGGGDMSYAQAKAIGMSDEAFSALQGQKSVAKTATETTEARSGDVLAQVGGQKDVAGIDVAGKKDVAGIEVAGRKDVADILAASATARLKYEKEQAPLERQNRIDVVDVTAKVDVLKGNQHINEINAETARKRQEELLKIEPVRKSDPKRHAWEEARIIETYKPLPFIPTSGETAPGGVPSRPTANTIPLGTSPASQLSLVPPDGQQTQAGLPPDGQQTQAGFPPDGQQTQAGFPPAPDKPPWTWPWKAAAGVTGAAVALGLSATARHAYKEGPGVLVPNWLRKPLWMNPRNPAASAGLGGNVSPAYSNIGGTGPDVGVHPSTRHSGASRASYDPAAAARAAVQPAAATPDEIAAAMRTQSIDTLAPDGPRLSTDTGRLTKIVRNKIGQPIYAGRRGFVRSGDIIEKLLGGVRKIAAPIERVVGPALGATARVPGPAAALYTALAPFAEGMGSYDPETIMKYQQEKHPLGFLPGAQQRKGIGRGLVNVGETLANIPADFAGLLESGGRNLYDLLGIHAPQTNIPRFNFDAIRPDRPGEYTGPSLLDPTMGSGRALKQRRLTPESLNDLLYRRPSYLR